MSAEDAARGGRLAGAVVAAVIIGAGAAGWYFFSDRGGQEIDPGGFDLSAAPQSRPAVAPASRAAPAALPSSLDMIRGAVGRPAGAPSAGPSPAAPAASGRDRARAEFTAQARKHEAVVRRFSERMTAKYPAIREYGKDWMSYPDLKRLNDDYMRTRDPVAFARGLVKSQNFPKIIRKYAAAPEIREFIVVGLTKEAPAELISAALDLVRGDPQLKELASSVAAGVGLPPDVVAGITGGAAVKQAKK